MSNPNLQISDYLASAMPLLPSSYVYDTYYNATYPKPMTIVTDPCPVCLGPVNGLKSGPTEWLVNNQSASVATMLNATQYTILQPCGHRVMNVGSVTMQDKSGKQFQAIHYEAADDIVSKAANNYQTLSRRIFKASQSLPGWKVQFNSQITQFCITMTANCPHGDVLDEAISWTLLDYAEIDIEKIADQMWLGIVHKCAIDHIEKKPVVAQSPYMGYADMFGPGQPLSVSSELTTSYADALSTYSLQMMQQYIYQPPGLVGYATGSSSVVDELAKLFPAIKVAIANCPACNSANHYTVANLIPHINDHHQWSREKIADWLDSLPQDFTLQPKGELTSA